MTLNEDPDLRKQKKTRNAVCVFGGGGLESGSFFAFSNLGPHVCVCLFYELDPTNCFVDQLRRWHPMFLDLVDFRVR